MTTLTGTVVNGVVILDGGPVPPDGTRVEVVVPAEPPAAPTLAERLLRHAGTVPGLPSDLAAQHDHYIHGTPKR
jgi:hypothetical protein